jgi:uncharacterized protein (TIGR00297 family)
VLTLLPRVLLGLALAALAAAAGYRRGSLSGSGAAGALLVGTATFGLGGWAWGLLIIVFFVTSSALSHFRRGRKAGLAEKFSKGERRDLAQTLANGGLGAALALLVPFAPHPGLWVAFAGAIATVNADTWATELGVLGRGRPRLITTGQSVETGTSGGVSWAGTGAALAGAALIGLCAGLFDVIRGAAAPSAAGLAAAATAAGLFGSLFDSLLGATAQAIYYCPRCGKETERHPRHICGEATTRLRGWAWLDNDWVNFISSAVGALAAVGLWKLL